MGLAAVNRETNFSKNYTYKVFPYKTPPEILEGSQKVYPVVIVGAGPIGLSLAINSANKEMVNRTRKIQSELKALLLRLN